MRRLFLVLFCASGAAGLVFEVLWTRLLTLVMGHSLAAVSTVLAAFMGGLALGAHVGGRSASGISEARALRLYVVMQVVVALSALAVPLVFAAARPLLAATYGDAGGLWFGPSRLIVALVTISVPAAAMGATLPLAVRWFARRVDRAGAEAGQLYAASTLGAALGAGAAAVVLLPALGLSRASWTAAALNLLAAWGAWAIARRDSPAAPAPEPAPPARQAAPPVERAPAAPRPHLAAAVLVATGFAGLASEVAWTRVLALVIGPTTYAFSIMLATFIAGLGLGALGGAWLAARARGRAVWLTVLVLAIAGLSAAALWRVAGLPVGAAEAIAGAGDALFSVVLRQTAIVAGMLLPIAMALGAVFPLAVDLAARTREGIAADVASLYASNTLGAVAGSLAAGFVLVPVFGLRGTLLIVIGLTAAAALAVAVLAAVWRPVTAGIAGLAALVVWAALAAPRWDPPLLASGAYKHAALLEAPDPVAVLTAGTLVYYREGASTVSVRRAAGARMLAIDGTVVASDAGDMLTQKLLAHLPLLLHPDPRRVAIVGLGSGVTLGAALAHPIDRADVIEISPEVFDASVLFADRNHRPLENPRTRAIRGDGRTHLLLSTETYDVIVSEPSNPWMAGVAPLFTREFLLAARARLRPGGIVCQWAPTYDIRDGDLRSIVATFASVFPQGTMWLVGEGDLLLIGSPAELSMELGRIRLAFERAGVAADLAEVGVGDVDSLLSLYAGGPAELRAFAVGAAVQTDDDLALEFSAPRGPYGGSSDANEKALSVLLPADAMPPPVRAAVLTESAGAWERRGRMLLAAEAYFRAFEAFARALALEPADLAAGGLVESAAGAARLPDALRPLIEAAERAPDAVGVQVALSRVRAMLGSMDGAILVVTPLLMSHPDDVRPVDQLASISIESGDRDGLRTAVDRLQAGWPDEPATAYHTAMLHLLSGAVAQAIAAAEAGAARHGLDARLQTVLGMAYAEAGRTDDARRALEAAAELDRRNPASFINLGLIELRADRPGAAVSRFGEALLLDPASPDALAGLAEALERLGQPERAARVTAAALAAGRGAGRR
jgi:spermidine synthase